MSDPVTKTTDTGSFVWKIPSMSIKTKEILCFGYIRENYSTYMTYPIIQLFAKYYNNDDYVLEDIKNAHQHEFIETFVSDLMTVHSTDPINFFVELYPNGCNALTKGKMVVFLGLLSTPVNISAIDVKYKIKFPSIKEIATIIATKTFTNDQKYAAHCPSSMIIDKLQNLNEFILNLDIEISSIRYKSAIYNNNKKTTISRSLNMPTSGYLWNINDTKSINQLKNGSNMGSVCSKPFQTNSTGLLKWYVQVYPCGSSKHNNDGYGEIYLSICSVPPHIKDIHVRYRLIIKETGISWVTVHCFNQSSLSWGRYNMLKTSDIQNINHFSIYIEIKILDIYDINGNIPKEYVAYNDNTTHYSYAQSIALPTPATYKWEISDKETLKTIKNIKNSVVSIPSPIFEAYSLKWYIKFWPNGSRESRNGTINIFFNLISLVSPTSQFVVRFDLSFIESNTSYKIYHIFKKQSLVAGETSWLLKTKDLLNLDKITVNIDLYLIDVYENNNIITSKYVSTQNKVIPVKIIKLPSRNYVWNISQNILDKMKTASNKDEFDCKRFEMYKMTWYLSIFPAGKKQNDNGSVNLCLHLISLPVNVSVVSIRYRLSIIETKTILFNSAAFTKDNLSKLWGPERLSNDKFINLNKCTIKLEMELVDVYGINQINVTDKFRTISADNDLQTWIWM